MPPWRNPVKTANLSTGQAGIRAQTYPALRRVLGTLNPTWFRVKSLYMHYVYILKSLRDYKLYVGRTDNLKRRILEHQNGKDWTTKRMLPIKLIFYECFLSKADAIRRERYLKTSKGKSTLKMMLRESLK